jgi:hypothetical protein
VKVGVRVGVRVTLTLVCWLTRAMMSLGWSRKGRTPSSCPLRGMPPGVFI